jgi:hypothetical protein
MHEDFLSDWLIEKIQNGEAILFLGAGATIGATSTKSRKAVNGNELRDLISDKFLGGKKKDWPLSRVADYAKNQSSLMEVQSFIKELFEPLLPAEFHELIPSFRWHAIITTNYDLVLERAYENQKERLQTLCPVISNDDEFSKKICDPSLLPYLKLHGCITRINDNNLPLILASEEYAKYNKNRQRLFSHLQEWGREHPIIFCGHEIEDPNIQHILFDLNDLGISRPKYALIKPSIDRLDRDVWMGRRFEVIKLTLENFLIELNKIISPANRVLSALINRDEISISKWISTNLSPSEKLILYLKNELNHIYKGMPIEGVKPKDFYKGCSDKWGVYDQELDVRRRITDDLLLECVLNEQRHKKPTCYLLKGHAGSGKNVTLKRAAFDSANEYDYLVFYLNEGGLIRPDIIRELFNLVNDQMIVFIDNILDHLPDFIDALKYFNKNEIPITFIFGARTNEWNVYGGDLSPLLNQEFELRDLSENEIITLLSKLERYNCLGHLSNLKMEERKALFKFDAERQLLVALHEATSGKSFEELVYDEYKNIIPPEAQVLYLDICTLHRLGAPVRAGLISRISGITFDRFTRDFLMPLEHVVRVYKDAISRDLAYRSRHPLIAKFVFEQVLKNPAERQEQIMRLLRYINVDFKWDNEAFTYLIKGRELANLFSDRKLIDQIYEVGKETGANIEHINHQEAIFELNHPAGSTTRALNLIRKIEEEKHYLSQPILHTKAMIYSKMANDSKNQLEKKTFRKNARELLSKLNKNSQESYPYTGMGRILIDEIKDIISEYKLSSKQLTDEILGSRVITDLISRVEQVISDGLQKFPNDTFLLTLQADLAKILHDDPSVLEVLEMAFAKNPRSELIGLRLGRQYMRDNKIGDATTVLKRCLENNPGSKRLHLLMAKTYKKINEEANKDSISHHLKRSFTEGDTNYESQILFARHEYLYGSKDKAYQIFDMLKAQRFPPDFRNRHWGVVKNQDGINIEHMGYVRTLTDNYCFVSSSTLEQSIFIYYSQFDSSIWEKVVSNSRISFNLAFTVRGPVGINAKLLNNKIS